MIAKSFQSELDLALARPDAGELTRLVDAYEQYFRVTDGDGEWPEDWSEAFCEMMDWPEADPEKALALVVIGAGRMTHASCLGVLACGTLEDLLCNPSEPMLQRIVAEARKSSRMRWMLSHPFKVAISDDAWNAIEKFRSTGPHEEPPSAALPADYFG